MSDGGLGGGDDVRVRFGASVDALAAGVTKGVGLVRDGVGQMQTHLGGLANVGTKVSAMFVGLAAITAGGRLFATAITDTVKMATEVGSLSRRLNVSAADASTFAVAIDDAFMSVDEFNTIAGQLNRQLRSQEDALKALGIKTRDTTGAYVDQKTLLLNTLDVLRSYRAGTDQLLAAQLALGRGITEEVLQKLFQMQENLPQAADDARELGLVMGVENVAAARAFKVAQDNAGDSLLGMKVTIGNALIPVFTEMLRLFSQAGASVIPVVSLAFRSLGVVLLGIMEVLYGLWTVFTTVVQSIVVGAVGMVDAITSLLSGDVQGAKDKWNAMTETIASTWEAAGKRIEDQSKRSREAMSEIWNGPSKTDEVYKEGSGRSGGKKFVPPDKNAAKDMLDQFKRELELLRQAQGDYAELSKQQEVEFWRSKLSIFAKGTKEWMEVNTLYLKARRDAAKESVEIQRFELDTQVQAAGTDAERKVQLAASWLARMKALYGADSREYREALRAKLSADREYEDQRRQFENQRRELDRDLRMMEIDMAREQAAMLVDLGAMSQRELIEVERALLLEKYNLQLQDIERRRQLYAGDIVMQEQLALEKKRIEAELQRDLQRSSIEAQRVTKSQWDDMLGGMFSTLGSVTMGLLNRTMTWKQAMLRIGDSLLQGLVNIGVQRLRDWIMSEILMTNASKAGAAARAAATAAGSGAVAATKATEATTVIAANASEAASGAAASQAAIPVVGPYLAMAAAAAMLAFVMGFGGKGGSGSSTGVSLPSARDGWWDIPKDTLAMVHANEMIMPPDLAQGVRNVVEAGGVGQGTMHVSIHAIDGPSVERLFSRHGDKIVNSLYRSSGTTNIRARR